MSKKPIWIKVKKCLIEITGMIPGVWLMSYLSDKRQEEPSLRETSLSWKNWRDLFISAVATYPFVVICDEIAATQEEKDLQRIEKNRKLNMKKTAMISTSTSSHWQGRERQRQSILETSRLSDSCQQR